MGKRSTILVIIIRLFLLVFFLPVPMEVYAISENTILAPAINKGNEVVGNASYILFDANQTNIESVTSPILSNT